ncbi:DUF4159 domain-containing protein [Pararhodobacter marinus]|uniref:LytTR family transcriptional regulator n=1 Tax=Pararhodobacter marinus TaxID=2184063 RepID=A0A2U2C492_9RHOB|nr:DUF4159 domain-containing protein [Pararhodobacter marinus]PWE26624.1 LytTR family transcriptional regulator [Pararhodobacter marinus]
MNALGFSAPVLLWALLALPILWWLLRAVPPAPVRRRFPGIALLLGLKDRDPESQRTPWWLLLIRIAALGALIVALAGPVLNPTRALPGQGPLVVVMDASWASARDWPRRIERATQALDEAQRAGRPVAVVTLTDPPVGALDFRAAEHWRERLPGVTPRPWSPEADLPDWVADLPEGAETLWFSDGLARDGRAALLAALSQTGPVQVFEPETPVIALAPATFDGEGVHVTARRTGGPAQALTLLAVGRDPAGAQRDLARAPLSFEAGATSAEASFDLPPELRNRITRFQVEGLRGAGAVSIADDSLRRRKVGLLAVREGNESLALLSPLHYLRQALEPSADLIESVSIDDLLLAGPDVIVLADMPAMTEGETRDLSDWVEDGGLLLRFAGPRMAGAGASASGFVAQAEDPLLPVPLRAGGRTVGGAMSWGDPRTLAPFADESPFAGLPIPADVGIRAQVLAQPGPDLADRTIAALADGTPLVTRAARGAGQVVLFHVTANAEWSNLPLSGLFVDMLDRLSVSTRGTVPEAGELQGTSWQPEEVMDGFGLLTDAEDRAAIAGEDLAPVLRGEAQPGPDIPPGLYAGTALRLAVNATGAQTPLNAAQWPVGTNLETGLERQEVPLAGYVFALAAVVLMLDSLATLALGGRLLRAAMVVLALGVIAPRAEAQPVDTRILEATEAVVLGAVSSGDPQVDDVALAGLRGLSTALYLRSSVEPSLPMAVDIETDELSVFPFLYWPVTAESPLPSTEAYARLNAYLRTGGMILFDTRDAEQARLTGGTTAQARRLQQIAAGLDIPPLEPVPDDHVLTRTFYLLSDYPGRYQGGTVWVEASPADAEQAEGMPFRNLNDGVTPVVIGSNDWASAWAVDDSGMPLLPVGRGTTGERQRELALRFGVNLIMHVLSGNYKSDQVHVPALLERLGQ